MTIITPTAPIAPINAELAQFVNTILALEVAGALEATFAPIIEARNAVATVTPVQSTPPAKRVRKSIAVADWQTQPAVKGSKQHVRIVAAELALLDAYEDAPIDGYSDIDCFANKGDMSEYYASLRPYLDAVDGIDIRQGSPYWTEAVALIAS